MNDYESRISNLESRTSTKATLKVALVCDWLLGTGGAERVVLELHHLFPEAPIYTSQYNSNPKIWYGETWFGNADVRPTGLQKLPRRLKKFLPVLRAWSFSRLDLSEYDLVISASGAEAKFVRTTPKIKKWARLSRLFAAQGASEDRKGGVQESTLTADRSSQRSDADESSSGVAGSAGKQAAAARKCVHVSYCHAPTHYYWSRYQQYLKNPGFGVLDPLARVALRLLVGPLRRWDYKAAQRPNHYITNSAYTKDQIKKYYSREAVVIHPPVDVERFLQHNQPADKRHGFVTAGRQTPYKKIDLAVEATSQLNIPLVVIGNGPDHKKLNRLAGRSVTFLKKVSDTEIPQKFAGAQAFIFPGVDDFGIVAVEALAAGTPVIAFKGGGALDYVNKDTGLFFDKPIVSSLVKAMTEFRKKSFNHAVIAGQAEKYSAVNFRRQIVDFLKYHRLV